MISHTPWDSIFIQKNLKTWQEYINCNDYQLKDVDVRRDTGLPIPWLLQEICMIRQRIQKKGWSEGVPLDLNSDKLRSWLPWLKRWSLSLSKNWQEFTRNKLKQSWSHISTEWQVSRLLPSFPALKLFFLNASFALVFAFIVSITTCELHLK
jgi:hypothetical protein